MSDFVHPSVMEKNCLRAKLDTVLEDRSITYDFHRAELEAIQKKEGLFTGSEWALIEFLYAHVLKLQKNRTERKGKK